MESVIIQELLMLVALIVLNGVIAGAEMIVISMRPSRNRELADSGSHLSSLGASGA